MGEKRGKSGGKNLMEQLIMRWTNDGSPAIKPNPPDGLGLITLPEMKNGVEQWLDVVQYGLSDGRQGQDYYDIVMVGHENYDAQYCYLLNDGNKAVATVTVIFDAVKSDGYIHMVACREDYRGRGIGTYMNALSVYLLKAHGMRSAYLTTDDWRIPAIKSYLRAGFVPDVSTDDFALRWEKIISEIEKSR